MKAKIVFKGGKGSGNFGHAGRPGKIGGSAPSKGGGASVFDPDNFAMEDAVAHIVKRSGDSEDYGRSAFDAASIIADGTDYKSTIKAITAQGRGTKGDERDGYSDMQKLLRTAYVFDAPETASYADVADEIYEMMTSL